MAKDPTQGPVTKYDGSGNPIKEEPEAEEPQVETQNKEAVEEDAVVEEAEAEEKTLTRSEVINEFGEELGGKLIEQGYASFSAMTNLDETQVEVLDLSDEEKSVVFEFLDLPGIGVIDDGPETAPTEEELEKQAEVLAELEEEEPAPEAIVYEFHEHRTDAPFTYQQAKDALEEFDYYDMRELAKESGIEPARKKDDLIQQLLDKWFPVPTQAPPEPPEGMSARIKRIRESQQ